MEKGGYKMCDIAKLEDIDPIIQLCYDYILPITSDRLLATHGNSISLIDIAGEIICTYDSIELPSYLEKHIVDEDTPDEYFDIEKKYIRNYLIIRQEGLYGIINLDGGIIVEPKHDTIKFTSPSEVFMN